MSGQFSEVQTTDSGRRYFANYDERFGNDGYVEIINDLDSEIGEKGLNLRNRYAFLYKNGNVKYIRDKIEQVADWFEVITINDTQSDPLEAAKELAEKLDNMEKCDFCHEPHNEMTYKKTSVDILTLTYVLDWNVINYVGNYCPKCGRNLNNDKY